jgi:hypothetical protein
MFSWMLPLAAHAELVAHIDLVSMGLLRVLAGPGNQLSSANKALVLVTKHSLSDDKHLLESRDGLLE